MIAKKLYFIQNDRNVRFSITAHSHSCSNLDKKTNIVIPNIQISKSLLMHIDHLRVIDTIQTKNIALYKVSFPHTIYHTLATLETVIAKNFIKDRINIFLSIININILISHPQSLF